MARISKSEAEYVEAVKKDHCKDCKMFREPRACTLVLGYISPEGHCRYFERKSKLPVAE